MDGVPLFLLCPESLSSSSRSTPHFLFTQSSLPHEIQSRFATMSGDPLSKRLPPDIDELVSCPPRHPLSTHLGVTWPIQEPAARRLWSHKRKVKTSYDDIFYRPPDHVVDNTTGDDAPAKKRRTDNSSKGKPRVTPCTGCILRMAENGPEHVCCYTDCMLLSFPSHCLCRYQS